MLGYGPSYGTGNCSKTHGFHVKKYTYTDSFAQGLSQEAFSRMSSKQYQKGKYKSRSNMLIIAVVLLNSTYLPLLYIFLNTVVHTVPSYPFQKVLSMQDSSGWVTIQANDRIPAPPPSCSDQFTAAYNDINNATTDVLSLNISNFFRTSSLLMGFFCHYQRLFVLFY
jgi:hypothetical protein